MGTTEKLGFKKKFKIYERKLTDKIKHAFINDTPPALAAQRVGGAPSVKAINSFGERYSFASLLPYESYDKKTGIYFNRDTIGFMLYCIPATAISSSELKVLNGIYAMRHKPNTSIQVSLYGDPNIDPILEKWKNFSNLDPKHKFKPMLDMLAQNRIDYLRYGKWDSLFSDEPALLKNIHLIISYTVPVLDGIAPVNVDDEEIDFLKRTRDSMIGTLRSSNILSSNMEPDALITLMDGMLNPSQEAKKPLKYDENNLINAQCIDADTMALWNAGSASIVHQDKPYTMLPFHVRQFPQIWPGFKNGELVGSFTNSILRHSCPFLLTLAVNVPDQVTEKSVVTQKQVRATQMVNSAISKYVPQWQTRKKDWDYVNSKVDEGNKLLDAFFQVLLFCPQGEEQKAEQALKGIYESFGWVISRSRYTPIHSFLGAIPMGICKDTQKALKTFGHYNKRLSWSCTNLAPWIAEFKGTKTPLLLLSGRKGQVSYFDNFDNEQGNYNISCCAASGGGKSVITQEYVIRTITDGGLSFVIDSGDSYREINKLLDGTYIDFDKGTPKLNPFSTIRADDPKFIKDQIPLLKLLFEQMASPDNALDQVYRSTLEKALMQAWHEKGNDADVDVVIDKLSDDKDENGKTTAEAVFLRKALYSYSSEGVYGDYFTGPSNIDLTNSFVVLELGGLNSTPDLQSVVLFILMMRITQVMYLSDNRSQRKMCIIDEAWRLLSCGSAGEFIEEGYRVARKYGGCFMTITQKISDYYQSETAKAAFMNADISMYLRQKPEELAQAEADGYIDNSGGKIDILLGLKTEHGKFSEIAISSPNGMSVNRFYIDPVASKLYSTTAKDVDRILELEEQGYSVLEAVNMMVADELKHTQGAV